MTALLYIFAVIGAMVTIGGIIAMGFDISQSRDDMAYWIHTRFPEYQKEIEERLAVFEAKINKPKEEVYVLEDIYKNELEKIRTEFASKFVSKNDYNRRQTDVIERCDDNAVKIAACIGRSDDIDACIKSIQNAIDRQNYNIDSHNIRFDHLDNEIDKMRKNAAFNIKDIEERLSRIEHTYIPKPAYDPYDVRLTEITVGDDPNQMSKGTTVKLNEQTEY